MCGGVLLLAIVLVATACGDEGSTGPASWTAEGIRAVSPLVGSGDTVAVVDGSTPDLKVAVLDAATGQVRFTRPWSPAGQFTGMGVGNPAIVGDVVVSMEGWGADTALIAFDVHSGAELWRVGVPEDTLAPGQCGTLVCSTEASIEEAAVVARDPATGATRWTSPDYALMLGADSDGKLIQLQFGAPVLSSLDATTGAVEWRFDISEVLGPDATTNYGWNTHFHDSVIALSVRDDLYKASTVGVDRSLGVPRWVRTGVGLCPSSSGELMLLCLEVDGAEDVVYRVDPATGVTLWSADRLALPDRGWGQELALAPDRSKLYGMDSSNHPVSIDAATGARAAPEPGTVVTWKQIQVEDGIDVRVMTPSGETLRKYAPTYAAIPWDPVANAAATNVSAVSDVPDSVGIDLAGYRVFADTAGIVRGLRV